MDTETVKRATGRKMERSGKRETGGQREEKEEGGGHRDSRESDGKEDGEIGEGAERGQREEKEKEKQRQSKEREREKRGIVGIPGVKGGVKGWRRVKGGLT